MPPPDELDAANVLEWAWSAIGFGSVSGEPVHGLAICRYGTDDCFYRFACNSDWQVIQDQLYPSTLAAKNQLPQQYQSEAPTWVLSEKAEAEIRSMTVNERLWFFGLFEEFSAAVASKRQGAIEGVLLAAHFSEKQAEQTAAAVVSADTP
jgi:hypothetical protein